MNSYLFSYEVVNDLGDVVDTISGDIQAKNESHARQLLKEGAKGDYGWDYDVNILFVRLSSY